MPPRLIFPAPDWRALAAVVPSVSPASCVHAHVAGEPVLVFTPVDVGVAPAGAFHAHVAGEPGLVFTPLGIAPADAFHAHVAGEPSLVFTPGGSIELQALVLTLSPVLKTLELELA